MTITTSRNSANIDSAVSINEPPEKEVKRVLLLLFLRNGGGYV